mgnify:CR=1 FL=1
MTSNIPKTEKSSPSSKSSEEADVLTVTPSATTTDIPSFGWSQYAERVNGRFAMIGFIAILLIETISQTDFLHWAGLIS